MEKLDVVIMGCLAFEFRRDKLSNPGRCQALEGDPPQCLTGQLMGNQLAPSVCALRLPSPCEAQGSV